MVGVSEWTCRWSKAHHKNLHCTNFTAQRTVGFERETSCAMQDRDTLNDFMDVDFHKFDLGFERET